MIRTPTAEKGVRSTLVFRFGTFVAEPVRFDRLNEPKTLQILL